MKEIAAALIFFTRIPFYKLKCFNVDPKYFKEAINYWSIAGWVTGGISVATLYLADHLFSYEIAIVLTLLMRVLITGALHEDGLADFVDGLGGGTTKKRVLEIMKDSHIGTYGVLSLIFYFMLRYFLLINLSFHTALVTLFVADTFCKMLCSHMTFFLPYARDAETSKAKLVYVPMSIKAVILAGLAGLLPLFVTAFFFPCILIAIISSIIVFGIVIALLNKRIQGYTGDCCGAIFLLCELAFFMAINGIAYLSPF